MSRDELKPGDICLIIGSKGAGVNVGKAGELISVLRPGDKFKAPNGRVLDYSPFGDAAWLLYGNSLGSRNIHGDVTSGFAIVTPPYLMKIKGDEEQPRERATDRVRDAEGVLR